MVRLLVRWSVIAVVAGASLLLPSTAWAHNFSGATRGTACANNMTDNRDHFFSYDALSAATTAAVNWSRSRNYDPTDLNTYTESRRTSQTDVVVFDADYEGTTCGVRWKSDSGGGGGAIGMALCQSLSGARCQQFFVYFDTDFMGPAPTGQELSLACHELGHTVGLLHAAGGCLATPLSGSTALTEHDRAHINSNY